MSAPPATVDARVRLAAALAAWGVALGAPHPATAAGVGALALTMRLGRPHPIRSLLPPIALALLAAPLLAATGSGRAALLLLARIVAAGWVASALTASVSRHELLAALGWARVPQPLLELLATADRQRHALAGFASSVRDALRLRLGWSGVRRSLRSAGLLAGLSVCRVVAQAEIASDALALRGARDRTAPPLQPVPGWRNARFGAATAFALSGCLLLPHLLPT